MKKRSIVIYVIVWALFLGWLLTSTKLMAHFSAAAQFTEIDFSQIKNSGDNLLVHQMVDATCLANSWDSTVNFTGWAFVDAEGDNPQRYISIILAGEKKSYELRIDEPLERPDVQKAFPDKKLPDVRVGVSIDATAMGIDNGMYDLYVYCWENEKEHGLADIGYQIVKRYDSVTLSTQVVSRRVEDLQATETELNRRSINVTLEDGYLQVIGWTFASDYDAETQTVYLSLTNEDGQTRTYTTKSKSRPDVAEAYQNELYENSGYSASIPAEEITDGVWTLRVWTENQGKVWTSSPADLVKTGDTVELQE